MNSHKSVIGFFGCGIDEIEEERFDKFNRVRQEFMHILEEKEQKTTVEHDIPISKVMHDMWDSKGVWFWHCIESVNAMLALLADHICPRYSVRLCSEVDEILSKFWREDSEVIVEKKVAEEKTYDEELRRLFGRASGC
jgi:hypothetical protein